MPSPDEILRLRLQHQLIERPNAGGALAGSDVATDPAGVVARMCAMQAQDYAGALWSIGLRSGGGCTVAEVECALAERRIVRTWPMRGTLHFLAPNDVRWMLALLAPRVIARAKTRHSQLGITDSTIERARALFSEALSGGRALSRTQMLALLETHGIDTTGQRGYHVLWTLAQQALLCFGPRVGRQQTFVLLDDWVPRAEEPAFDRAAALAELASRYFAARGPATVADFAWWAGITRTEASAGIEGANGALRQEKVDGIEYWSPADSAGTSRASSAAVHLLPGFDEYLLGYSDRSLQLGGTRESYAATISANGMFSATVVIGGRVVGTWKRTLRRDHVDIAALTFRKLATAEKAGLTAAAGRYGRFLGLSARVTY
jgi:hypothetical protein